MAVFTILPIPIDGVPIIEYGNENFIEIHLDERLYVEGNMQLCKVREKNNDGSIIIKKNYKIFHDADQCIDFIASYEWRKVFLTLTDKFSYLLELIHDLPQIVFFYIYSTSPSLVSYKTEQYSKLRTIVQENSPDTNNQLLEDIEIFQRDLMPINPFKPIKRKTKLLIQEAFNIDEYSIIWLQDNECTTTIDTSSLSKIINSLKIFFSLDQCIDFIKSSNNTRIFFISSHSKSNMIVEKVSDHSQIIAIYILRTQQELVINSQVSTPKFRGIYSNIENLTEALSKEYERCLKSSQLPISVFSRDENVKTVRDLSKDNVRYLWFQLLIDILIRIPYNDCAKDEMLHECRKHYGIPCKDDEEVEENMVNMTVNNCNKKAETDIINFEKNYKSNEALKFYTNDSFLYRLFNQALRTENIDLLFIFRFFLADMYKHLQKLYLEQFPDQLPHTVFRGQLMTNQEFNSLKDNIGRSMSINTFFSTTEDRDVAVMFSGSGDDPNMLSVLFEIEVNVISSGIKRPLASINHLSTFSDESEVLFSVGSMFRIESIQDRRTIKDEGYWYVKLKLIEDDIDMNEFRKDLEKEYCDKSDLCSLGSVLTAMGDYKRAERYFRMLIEYIPEDHTNMYRVYSSLGKIVHNRGDYQISINYHEKALEYLNKPDIHNENENIGREYVAIASSYRRLGNLDLAMKYVTMATDIQTSPSALSSTYHQIALLYRDKGDNRLALEYFLKTLHIQEQILKINQYQPELATTYNNIGEIYDQLDDYDNAVKYLHHALDIRLKGTVSTHTDLAAVYNNLGVLYLKKNELKEALEVFEKALEIDTQALGDNHESLAVTHNNISAVYRARNDSARALHHLETALRILLHSQAGENHLDIATFQFNIGVLQLSLGNSIKALKITQKALQNQLKTLPKNHERLAHTYFLLSKIYYEKQQNKSTALEYMEKAVEVARISILPKNKIQFEDFQSQLNLLKNDQVNDSDRYQQASTDTWYTPDNLDLQDCLLSNYSEELTQISPDDILKRLELLNTIGSIHSKKENYPMAMKCFNEAVELYLQNQTSNRLFPQQLEDAMTNIYYSMSRLSYRQENWTMSLNHLEKALDLALKQPQESLMLAEIYNCMGLSYSHKRDISMTIHYFELAVSTGKKVLPDDHPRLQIYDYHLQESKLLMRFL